MFDYDPTVDNNVYEKFGLEELETILSSLNAEEEMEITKVKEKYYQHRLHLTRLLAGRRPAAETNNSCPNIAR